MYDDFFFPYEKAKLWTGNMFLLSLSNFFALCITIHDASCAAFMDGAALGIAVMRKQEQPLLFSGWPCSFREHSTATLLIRSNVKSVCFIAIFLFVASSLLYPYVATVGFVALVRAVQGGLFSVITMTTGSTLVIDVTASRRRTDANIAFAWAGRLEWWWVLPWGSIFILIGIFTISFIPVWL